MNTLYFEKTIVLNILKFKRRYLLFQITRIRQKDRVYGAEEEWKRKEETFRNSSKTTASISSSNPAVINQR